MEYDEVQEGAEWQAIVRIENGIAPACIELDKPGQKIVKTDEWGGKFQGLKENWVFFDAADGADRGIPFIVYDWGNRKENL